MKSRIKNIVKKSIIIYNIYFYVFSFLLKILGLFIKTDDNLILFVVYGGKRYDDSPKVIYEYMKNNEKYNNYKYVWAFNNIDEFNLPKDEKVKIDTFKYYITALKAKYWITNSSITRGLDFKKKKTKYINFQHGTIGIKKMGKDIPVGTKSFKMKNNEKFDMFIIQGKKEKQIVEDAFDLKNKVFEYGLPRNDELWNGLKDKKNIDLLKEKFNVPKNKKVILYAPTYREYCKDEKLNVYFDLNFNYKELKEKLESEYVFLIRTHYEVSKFLNIPENDNFMINVSNYPKINDLFFLSDILITDYSSVVFDYSILEKPIFCYGYDYDLYMKERGTYIDLKTFFCDGVIENSSELIEKINNMNYEKEVEHSKKIKEDYVLQIKNSTEFAIKNIFDEGK